MSLLNKIKDNPIFKVSSLNTISVLIRIAGGLVASKVIAVFIGPSGLAFIGNFRNFLRQAEVFGMLGFENGIIKYIAENDKDPDKRNSVINTVLLTVSGAVFIAAILLLLFAETLSSYYFEGSTEYRWIFRVLALAMPMYIGNFIIISILNGMSRYKQVIRINIIGNVSGVILSAFLIWQYKVAGALVGLVVPPSLMFIVSFLMLMKQAKGSSLLSVSRYDTTILKGLLSFSLMSLVTAAIAPQVAISIRTHIITDFSAEEAGFWEAISRISFFYLMFVSTLLTVYFFPKLSSSGSAEETKGVFWSYYKTIVPVFGAGLILVYFLRRFIILVLFDEDFLPMENLFIWQLTGDFFKACSLILGYQFFAAKNTKGYIITEVASYTLLYFSSHYLISIYGSEGAVMAHTFTYIIYLIILTVYFRKKLF